MKRLTVLLVSLFIAVTLSPTAYADHHDRGRHQAHKEYRHDKKNHHPDKGPKHDKGHKVAKPPIHNRAPHRDKYDRHCQVRLKDMVKYATRGGHSVKVWRISDDTFVIKYNRGGKWYMQRLYPYNGRYGSPIHIIIEPNGEWYPYSNRGQRYIPNGDRLQFFINGVAQAAWQLLPALF